MRAALVAAGATPVSEPAAEVVRVEHGRPRYGVDLDDATIPQEAGLNERAVSFTKGCYVGQETVARLFYRGKPNRHLRGLALSGPARSGDELRLGERVVGRARQHRALAAATATSRSRSCAARSPDDAELVGRRRRRDGAAGRVAVRRVSDNAPRMPRDRHGRRARHARHRVGFGRPLASDGERAKR